MSTGGSSAGPGGGSGGDAPIQTAAFTYSSGVSSQGNAGSSAGAVTRLVSSSAYHFLLLEMVRLVEQIAAVPAPLPGAVTTSENGSTSNANLAAVDREAVYYKLELLGYNVGQRFVERMVRDHPRFQDTLDVVKFICKEFWSAMFQKQIDNLKTNHRGVYVLQDNAFKWFMKASSNHTPDEMTQQMASVRQHPIEGIRI